MAASLYERLGGEAAVETAVDIFYRKVLGDRNLRRFFETTDIAALRQKQKAFLTVAFGGPNKYTGRDLRTAHKKLIDQGMTDLHFDLVARHLGETLGDLKVAPELCKEVLAIAEGTRRDVMNR